MKRDKDVEKKDERTETVVVIGRPYSLPKKFVEFQNGFEAEAKKTLQNCKGRRPDMMNAMEHRIHAEGERAKGSIQGEHTGRCQAIKNFRGQREKEKTDHEIILSDAKAKIIEKRKEFNSLSGKSGVSTSKPFWATKWMIAIMSIAFLILDSYLFFIFTKEMNINVVMKIGVAILLGVLITVPPIVSGYSFDRWTSALEDVEIKKKYRMITWIAVSVYLIFFVVTVVLRFASSDMLIDSDNNHRSFALSLLFAAVPLVTGAITAYISFETGNTVREELIKLQDEIEGLQTTIREKTAKLVEYEDLDGRQRDEEAAEDDFLQNALDLITKECDALYARLPSIK